MVEAKATLQAQVSYSNALLCSDEESQRRWYKTRAYYFLSATIHCHPG